MRFAPICQIVCSRLKGGLHPSVNNPQAVGMEHLKPWCEQVCEYLLGTARNRERPLQQANKSLQYWPTNPNEFLSFRLPIGATDAVSISIGRASRELSRSELIKGTILRVGKGARMERSKTKISCRCSKELKQNFSSKSNYCLRNLLDLTIQNRKR